MKMLKLTEKDMQSAMRRIHREFGSDAMIVSNRQTSGGCEVSFAIDDDLFLAPDEKAQENLQAWQKSAGSQQQNGALGERAQSAMSKPELQNYISELSDVADKNFQQAQLHSTNQQTIKTQSPNGERALALASQKEEGVKVQLSNSQAHSLQGEEDLNLSEEQQSLDMAENPFASRHSFRQVLNKFTRLGGKSSECQAKEAANHTPDNMVPLNPEQHVQSDKPSQDSNGFQALDIQQRQSLHGESATLNAELEVEAAFNNADMLLDIKAQMQALLRHQQELEQTLQQNRNEALNNTIDGPKALQLKARSAELQKVFHQLVFMGFKAELAWQCLCCVEDIFDRKLSRTEQNFDAAWKYAMDFMMQKLQLRETEFHTSSVHAFCGLAGSGKTAAISKIATKFCQENPAKNIVLIQFKQDKIAALEELLYWGELLGVATHLAKDSASLEQLLNQYRHNHLVLIDSNFDYIAQWHHALGNSPIINQSFFIHAVMALDSHLHLQQQFLLQCEQELAGLQQAGVQTHSSIQVDLLLTRLDRELPLVDTLQVLMRSRLVIGLFSRGAYTAENLLFMSAKALLAKCIRQSKQASRQQALSPSAGLTQGDGAALRQIAPSPHTSSGQHHRAQFANMGAIQKPVISDAERDGLSGLA